MTENTPATTRADHGDPIVAVQAEVRVIGIRSLANGTVQQSDAPSNIFYGWLCPNAGKPSFTGIS